METHKLISTTTKATSYLLFLILTIAFTTSARILDEEPVSMGPGPAVSNPNTTPVTNIPPIQSTTQPNPSVAATTSATTGNSLPDPDHTFTFFMHDILGGSNPSSLAVTAIVNNPAVNGQLPFAKPNGANLPVNSGIPQNNNNNGLINNNNIPLITGLGGTTQNVVQNNNNNGFNFPVTSGGQLQSGSTPQKLMFGTLTVIDDELTEGHELGSALLGKAQGFYVASSIDGTSQTMAFTAMFESGHYVDSLSFFGIHRTGVSESQLAIMGGTGKYVNAKGFAIVKTITGINQNNTDGVETLLEFAVYVSY